MLASLKRPLRITMVNTTNLRKTFYAFVGVDPSALLNNGLHTHTHTNTQTHMYIFLILLSQFDMPLFLPSSISFLITRIHHNLQGQVQTPFSPWILLYLACYFQARTKPFLVCIANSWVSTHHVLLCFLPVTFRVRKISFSVL